MPETLPPVCEAMGHLDRTEPAVVPAVTSPAADEMEMLNDEVLIEAPPDRPRGTIRVRLVYAGRSTPIPAEDPWAE